MFTKKIRHQSNIQYVYILQNYDGISNSDQNPQKFTL